MEKYRQILNKRIKLLAVLALCAAGLGVYDVFFADPAVKESAVFGLMLGALTALGLMSAVLILRFRIILRDDVKLKTQYNKESDERLKSIRAKAGMPVLLLTSAGMIAAGIAAAHFNTEIFIALVTAAICQMLTGAVIKLIYLRKI